MQNVSFGDCSVVVKIHDVEFTQDFGVRDAQGGRGQRWLSGTGVIESPAATSDN